MYVHKQSDIILLYFVDPVQLVQTKLPKIRLRQIADAGKAQVLPGKKESASNNKHPPKFRFRKAQMSDSRKIYQSHFNHFTKGIKGSQQKSLQIFIDSWSPLPQRLREQPLAAVPAAAPAAAPAVAIPLPALPTLGPPCSPCQEAWLPQGDEKVEI